MHSTTEGVDNVPPMSTTCPPFVRQEIEIEVDKEKERDKEVEVKPPTPLKSKKAKSFADPNEVFFPNDQKLDEAFREYVKMRAAIKKPLTDFAKKLDLKKIMESGKLITQKKNCYYQNKFLNTKKDAESLFAHLQQSLF